GERPFPPAPDQQLGKEPLRGRECPPSRRGWPPWVEREAPEPGAERTLLTGVPQPDDALGPAERTKLVEEGKRRIPGRGVPLLSGPKASDRFAARRLRPKQGRAFQDSVRLQRADIGDRRRHCHPAGLFRKARPNHPLTVALRWSCLLSHRRYTCTKEF